MPWSKPEIVGELIEVNTSIRDLARLKGKAYVMKAGRLVLAEVHWYECTGIGRLEEREKLYLEE